MKKKKILISIITPVYNEQKNVLDCNTNVKNFFKKKKQYNYEHLFVDNNSSDNTRSILQKLSKQDKKIKLIFNKKNYQVLPSIFNALYYAKGDAILLCYAADGQDPISTLEKYLNYYEKNYKVITAQRFMRKENIFWQIIKTIYYFIYINFNKIQNIRKKKHYFVNVFQLIDRSILKKIIKTKYLYPHLPSLTYRCCPEKKIISVQSKWIKRRKGKSHNNIINYLTEAYYCLFNFTFFIEFLIVLTGICLLYFFNNLKSFLFIYIPVSCTLYIILKICNKTKFSNNKDFLPNKK